MGNTLETGPSGPSGFDRVAARSACTRHHRARCASDFAVIHAHVSAGRGEGRGAIIEDVDGNRFLDFNAGIAVVATGHCHPQVVRAIQGRPRA